MIEVSQEELKCVVASGNPFDGMTVWGPFNSTLEAADWADKALQENTWTIVPVYTPV